MLNVQSRWHDPEVDEHHIEWTRASFDAMSPFSTDGVYVDFIDSDEGSSRVRAAYSEEIHNRLTGVKAE